MRRFIPARQSIFQRRKQRSDMTKTRIEHDTLGNVEVPTEHLWGAQTQRSKLNFAISGEHQPAEIIHALATVKKASAKVNHALGLLDEERSLPLPSTFMLSVRTLAVAEGLTHPLTFPEANAD